MASALELTRRSCLVFSVVSHHIGRVFLPPGKVCHDNEEPDATGETEEGVVVPVSEV